ncbi:MAG: hypothetical protein QOG05_155 [Streptosporangiaceae bacterium]|nr:hypothetical protein [Streptosporangiaceae bacterium]
MVVERGDLACCVRCAGPAAAERLERRHLLKAAVHPPARGPSVPVSTAAAAAAPATAAPAAGAAGPERDAGVPPPPGPACHPGVLTGTVLDTSPQIVTLYCPDGERRIALAPGASVWKGRPADPTVLESGDSVVVRMHPAQRSVAERIWANAGRVTGVIMELDREGMLVDEGRTTRHQAVLIPPHAMGRLQVRFPRLEPGYLVDFIGLRGRGYLEALVPATSQPAYRASEAPARAPVRGHPPDRIAGSAIWHEPAGPADEQGVRYPALDPDTACQEQPLAGSACPRLPYLSVGSLLKVRNECTGTARVLPVSGCAATAQIFCDRCVTCGTSPRGRIADLPMISFVAMGGDLERGCFNATVSLGARSPASPGPGSRTSGFPSLGTASAGQS